MADIKKINHIALVVEDIEEALTFWRDVLGVQLDHIAEEPRENASVAFLNVGESEIELVQPTRKDSGIAKYLSKRGPGMHHICFEVNDLVNLLDELREKGIQLINQSPVVGDDGRKYAFIHPKSAHGVLVELYEI